MIPKQIKYRLVPGLTKKIVVDSLLASFVEAFVDVLDFDKNGETTQSGVLSFLMQFREDH